MIIFLTISCGIFLAYANGANDNFKGVATLFGSGTTNYKSALRWATITTFAGSFSALFIASKLLVIFSGKGLVPADISALPSFALAVGFSAAVTVLLATKMGFPISTTHALTGALVGAGIFASPVGVNFTILISKFAIPLLISPILAIFGALIVYPFLKKMREKLKVERDYCLCVGEKVYATASAGSERHEALTQFSSLEITTGTDTQCIAKYRGQVFGVNVETILAKLHFLSAGVVCFARGLNDAPKIGALLLISGSIFPQQSISIVAIAMAIGGLVSARKVAETMSLKVTPMNAGQGFSANIVTAVLVIFASRLGVPVSTTHVSCGSLFGIGAVTGQARWKNIFQILIAWITTLPVAAILGVLFFFTFKTIL